MTSRVAVVLGVLLLAGCGAEPLRPPRPIYPTVNTFVPLTTASTVPYRTVDSNTRFTMGRTACAGGSPYNSASLPYQGAGPHWAAVTEMPGVGPYMQHAQVISLGDSLGTPNNVNLVQLLVCVIPVVGGRAGSVTCEFDKDVDGVATSRTWAFHEASYEVAVQEALTGRVVTTLPPLAGGQSPDESCPSFASDDPGTVVARSLTEEALGEALRPLVEGPA